MPRGDPVVHELSAPGGRPLCGAEAIVDPPRLPRTVTCAACRRLVADDTRRPRHAARPPADETED